MTALVTHVTAKSAFHKRGLVNVRFASKSDRGATKSAIVKNSLNQGMFPELEGSSLAR